MSLHYRSLAYHTAFIVVKMCKLKRQVEITPTKTTLSTIYVKNVLGVTIIHRSNVITADGKY